MACGTITADTLQAIGNSELLEAFEAVCDDVTRRIANYETATDPVALLDGIKFADTANEIAGDMMFGCSLGHRGLDGARDRFTDLLISASFDDSDIVAPAGADLDA